MIVEEYLRIWSMVVEEYPERYDQWSNYKINIDSLKPLYFLGARDKTSWGQDRNIFTEINTWEIF